MNVRRSMGRIGGCRMVLQDLDVEVELWRASGVEGCPKLKTLNPKPSSGTSLGST